MILEELYYGNIRPIERGIKKDSEYYKLIPLIEKNENKLFEKLSQEDKGLYESIKELRFKQACVSENDVFIEGFRLGAKIMLEILDG